MKSFTEFERAFDALDFDALRSLNGAARDRVIAGLLQMAEKLVSLHGEMVDADLAAVFLKHGDRARAIYEGFMAEEAGPNERKN